jgi:hypothetical protein
LNTVEWEAAPIEEGRNPVIRLVGLKKRRRDKHFIRNGLALDCISCRAFEQPSFHGFNDLPTGIRHKIWSYAIPKPRIVRIELDFAGPKKQRGLRFKSDGDVISLLGMNKESRGIALQVYTSCLHSKDFGSIIRFQPDDTIFFRNFGKLLKYQDQIRQNPASDNYIDCRMFGDVKNMAIDFIIIISLLD